MIRLDTKSLEILKKEIHVNKQIKITNKRVCIFDENGKWINTRPRWIKNYGEKGSTRKSSSNRN